jgi:hypothetical protein
MFDDNHEIHAEYQLHKLKIGRTPFLIKRFRLKAASFGAAWFNMPV